MLQDAESETGEGCEIEAESIDAEETALNAKEEETNEERQKKLSKFQNPLKLFGFLFGSGSYRPTWKYYEQCRHLMGLASINQNLLPWHVEVYPNSVVPVFDKATMMIHSHRTIQRLTLDVAGVLTVSFKNVRAAVNVTVFCGRVTGSQGIAMEPSSGITCPLLVSEVSAEPHVVLPSEYTKADVFTSIVWKEMKKTLATIQSWVMNCPTKGLTQTNLSSQRHRRHSHI